MGLFSFTDEEYAAYEARRPADPAAGAAAAMGRIEVRLEAAADLAVRTVGPRRAMIDAAGGPWMARSALEAVVMRLVGAHTSLAAPFGARAVVDAWTIEDDNERLQCVRLALRNQYATRATGTSPQRDKAAQDAVAAWRALEMAESGATNTA